MKKLCLLFLIVFGFSLNVFASRVTLDEMEVGSFDEINNTYYLRNIEVFYDEETGLIGFSYYKDQLSRVKYTFNFASQGEIDSVINNLENALNIISGKVSIESLGVSGAKNAYEFSSRIDLERDELIDVAGIGSVARTYSSFKLSFFIEKGWKSICAGGDKVTFTPSNKKVAIEVFGFNEDSLSRFLRALKKENLDSLQREYYKFLEEKNF